MAEFVPDRSVALVGGRVVPITGQPIEGGTVLVSAGRIQAVGGAGTPVPDGCPRVDVGGRWVLPGFVDAHTHLGNLEDGVGPAGSDLSEDTVAVGARFRALDAVNPDDVAFRDAIAGGVLAVGINPGSSAPIGGQSVAVRCHGDTVDAMVLREPCGMKSGIGENPKRDFGGAGRMPATRMGTASVIREALTRARRRLDDPATQEADTAADLDSKALARVLTGEIPWRQHVHRADDIATAIRLSDEFGYRLVIDHGTEADRLADRIAERDIPVITGPLVVCRFKNEMSRRALRTPGRLASAGVKIAIATDHGVIPIQFLVYQAALAVREGLDAAAALRALTVNPAEILGIDDRVGSLEPGKDADLCVWSGDPLDAAQRVEAAYVRGQQVYHYDHDRGTGVLDGADWSL